MLPDSIAGMVQPSFLQPIPAIMTDPGFGDMVCVTFNRAWLPAVLGALLQLLEQDTWSVSTPDELLLVQQLADTLIYQFIQGTACAPLPAPSCEGGAEEDEPMIRQNPSNPCELQTSIDGTTWCTFADFSLCLPAPRQPGGGTPQPSSGGGQACYRGELTAEGRWVVPTVVSTGDVIALTDVIGAGEDAGVPPWYCPDGTIFFAGACVIGTGGTDSGDPLNTVKHMRLLYKIGGSYYDAMAGSFTVPSGVANEQVEIQVNDDDLADNTGSYQFQICVTNNQVVGSWSHTFDFALGTQGWSPISGLSGGWSGGKWIGFLTAYALENRIYIDSNLLERVTHFRVQVNIDLAAAGGADFGAYTLPAGGGSRTALYNQGLANNSTADRNATVEGDLTIAPGNQSLVFQASGMYAAAYAETLSIQLSGVGSDPF